MSADMLSTLLQSAFLFICNKFAADLIYLSQR